MVTIIPLDEAVKFIKSSGLGITAAVKRKLRERQVYIYEGQEVIRIDTQLEAALYGGSSRQGTPLKRLPNAKDLISAGRKLHERRDKSESKKDDKDKPKPQQLTLFSDNINKIHNMFQTRLMQRIFSAQRNQESELLNQLYSDIEIAKEDGVLDTEEYIITSSDEDEVDIYDKVNDETTTIVEESDSEITLAPKKLETKRFKEVEEDEDEDFDEEELDEEDREFGLFKSKIGDWIVGFVNHNIMSYDNDIVVEKIKKLPRSKVKEDVIQAHEDKYNKVKYLKIYKDDGSDEVRNKLRKYLENKKYWLDEESKKKKEKFNKKFSTPSNSDNLRNFSEKYQRAFNLNFDNYAVVWNPDTGKYRALKRSTVYADKSKGYIIKVDDAGSREKAQAIAREMNEEDSKSKLLKSRNFSDKYKKLFE